MPARIVQVHRTYSTYQLTPATALENDLTIEVRCPTCSPPRRLQVAARGVLARYWSTDWEAIFKAGVLVCSRCRQIADGLRIIRPRRDSQERLLTIVCRSNLDDGPSR